MLRTPGASVLVICLCHCSKTLRPVNDPAFTIVRGLLMYKGTPFTGWQFSISRGTGTRRETPYKNGVQHGLERSWHRNGELAAQGHFENGKKSGLHRGWHPNGKDHFFATFQDGKHQGDYWRWYSNGQLFQYARYDNGKQSGQKTWRSNGQIFMNYVVAAGQNLGFKGAKPCNPLKKQISGIKKAPATKQRNTAGN